MDHLADHIQIALQTLKRNIDLERQNTRNTSITKPQMLMLYTVYKLGTCKLSQLAEKLEVKPSAITVMVDRLEKESCMKRTQDETDRRAIFVELTELGKQIIEDAMKERNKILRSYLAKLETEEMAQLSYLLNKLVSPIEE